MKFQGPAGVTGISVGGEQFNADENGIIETPDNGEYASLLAPHGFDVIPQPAQHSPSTPEAPAGETKLSDGMTVAQIKEALTASGVEIPAGAKKEELAALLDGAPSTPEAPAGDEGHQG